MMAVFVLPDPTDSCPPHVRSRCDPGPIPVRSPFGPRPDPVGVAYNGHPRSRFRDALRPGRVPDA